MRTNRAADRALGLVTTAAAMTILLYLCFGPSS